MVLADPRYWIWNGSFHDFDRANEAVRGFGLSWLQLDRGATELRFQQIGSPNVLLSRLSVTRKYHQQGVVPEGTWTFAVIGRNAPNLEWHGDECTASHIFLYPRHDEYQLVTHPGNHGDVISVSDELIRSTAELLGLPDPADVLPGGMAFLEVGSSRTERIRRTLSQLHFAAHARRSTTGAVAAWTRFENDLVAELLAAVLVSPVESQSMSAPWKRNRALHRAVDFIKGHAEEAPSIAEVCRAAGSSWRTLDYTFRERFGVTPKQYLQAVRLQSVRGQLSIPGGATVVSEAAAACGFWHMGRFAAEYRSFFGELPSETLQRRVGRTPAD